MSNLDLPTSGDTQNYFKSPLEGPNMVAAVGLFQVCLQNHYNYYFTTLMKLHLNNEHGGSNVPNLADPAVFQN